VAKLRTAQLWSTYERKVSRLLLPGFTACAYDPLERASSIAVGTTLKPDGAVMVVRGVDRDKALECLQRAPAELDPKIDSEMATLTKPGGNTFQMAFADASTLLVRVARTPDRDAVKQVLQLGAPLLDNPGFVAADRALGPTDEMTLLSRPDSTSFATVWSGTGTRLKRLSGKVNLGDRLTMQLVMVLETADQAAQLGTMLSNQFHTPTIKTMFDVIEARTQADTITLDVALAEPKLGSMMTLFGMTAL
jgi:hypothetical protein